MLLSLNHIPARLALFVSAFCLSIAGANGGAFSPHTFTIPEGYELELAAAPGAEIPVRSKNIVEAKYSSVSLMLEVHDTLLSPQELADLVAYLMQAK